MCTPLGHSIVGYSVAMIQSGVEIRQNGWMLLQVILFANLPDINLLFGYAVGNPNRYHHLWTHSLSFVLLAGLLYGVSYTLLKKKNGFKAGLIISGIVFSHIVLDFFSKDTRVPYGMPLFWPISEKFYLAPVTLFLDINKASSNDAFLGSLFCLHNLRTILFEVAVMTPLLVWIFIRHKKTVQKSGAS